ncbi:hypothetical protein V1514DRAFT_631 [Lipomyces japonicus]|uniref:uncharacterized protein n=1 Tax=Lipomyces japonicus TaxID=56871 RepID=UPI0034CFBDEC
MPTFINFLVCLSLTCLGHLINFLVSSNFKKITFCLVYSLIRTDNLVIMYYVYYIPPPGSIHALSYKHYVEFHQYNYKLIFILFIYIQSIYQLYDNCKRH